VPSGSDADAVIVTVPPARNVAPFAGDVMLTVGSWLGAVQFSVIAVEVCRDTEVVRRARSERVRALGDVRERHRIRQARGGADQGRAVQEIDRRRSSRQDRLRPRAGDAGRRDETVVQLSGEVITTSGGAPTEIETGADVVTAFWLSVALAVRT
jgi:hypothetical protein